MAAQNVVEPTLNALGVAMNMIQAKMGEMETRLALATCANQVEEYAEVRANVQNVDSISLDMFKTLPTFGGDRAKYVAWRNSAKTAIQIFNGHMEDPKYFQALNIVRNKIIDSASEVLTNYNTVFNFDAMIARLDFTYADKRPMHIIESELIVLQQRQLSIDDFYDEVNKKLNALINKINMTHKEKEAVKAMTQDANDKALRTFITGLRGNLVHVLYAANPTTLPEAYARVQTILNDRERIRFANQHHQGVNVKYEMAKSNPNFRPKSRPQQLTSAKTYEQTNKSEPMEIDKSSMNVNVGQHKQQQSMNTGMNRRMQTSGHHSGTRRFQQINQVEDDANDDNNEYTSEAEIDDLEEETSSVFLD